MNNSNICNCNQMLRFLFNYRYILGTLNQHKFHCLNTAHTYDNELPISYLLTSPRNAVFCRILCQIFFIMETTWAIHFEWRRTSIERVKKLWCAEILVLYFLWQQQRRESTNLGARGRSGPGPDRPSRKPGCIARSPVYIRIYGGCYRRLISGSGYRGVQPT